MNNMIDNFRKALSEPDTVVLDYFEGTHWTMMSQENKDYIIKHAIRVQVSTICVDRLCYDVYDNPPDMSDEDDCYWGTVAIYKPVIL